MLLTDYPVSIVRAVQGCGPYDSLGFVGRIVWTTRLLAVQSPSTRYLPTESGARYTEGTRFTSSARQAGGCLLGEAITQEFPELSDALKRIDEYGSVGIAELVEQVFPLRYLSLSTQAAECFQNDLRWMTALQTAEAVGYSWLHAVNYSDSIVKMITYSDEEEGDSCEVYGMDEFVDDSVL